MNPRRVILTSLLIFLAAGVSVAGEQSLAEAARQARQQHDKETKKVLKVLTNDNLPAPAPWEAVNFSPDVKKSTIMPEAGNETKAKQADSAANAPEAAAGTTEDKKKTKEYWQDKFIAARSALAGAEGVHRLAEDELGLLQIQQARELAPDIQSQVATKITDKQSEIATLQARVDKARQALDDLQKDFDASGSPVEWSQTEPLPADNEKPGP